MKLFVFGGEAPLSPLRVPGPWVVNQPTGDSRNRITTAGWMSAILRLAEQKGGEICGCDLRTIISKPHQLPVRLSVSGQHVCNLQ